MNKALDLWREKLEHFQLEEATVVDPEHEFKLKKLIAEAKAKIAELEAGHIEVPTLGWSVKSRTFPKMLTIILLAVLVLAALATAYALFPRNNLEIARLIKLVEEMQKNLPKQLDAEQIAQEAQLRTSEPEKFRAEDNYWPNKSTLRIAFLDGDTTIQNRVLAIAQEWTKYANLTFIRSELSDSDIRISFNEPGEWSYLGTQALSIPIDQKTTNLGINFEDQAESRFLILHTFGHVLGLIHENQTPAAKHLVNIDKARARFGGPSSGTDREFITYEDAGIFYATKAFDPYSVMLPKLPAEILNPGMDIEPGDQLSSGDIALIRKIYPGR